MFANKATGSGEGIILANKLHGISIATGANQSDVAGDIHLSRAQSHAGDGLMQMHGAFALLDVVDIVFAEAL